MQLPSLHFTDSALVFLTWAILSVPLYLAVVSFFAWLRKDDIIQEATRYISEV